MDYKEFNSKFPLSKRESDPFWCRVVLRPLSMPISYKLYCLGVKANSISILAIAFVFVGSLCIATSNFEIAIIGSILLIISSLLDCIDGNIARAGGGGLGGDWVDAVIGYTAYLMIPICLGFRAENLNQFDFYLVSPILLGAIASSTNLYSRLLHQKLEVVMNPVKFQNESSALRKKSTYKKLLKEVSGHFGLVGLMMPTLLAAIIFNFEYIYLVAYAFIYFFAAIFTLFHNLKSFI